MILVDANLLLYAYDSSSTHHRAARRWLEEAFSGHQPVIEHGVTLHSNDRNFSRFPDLKYANPLAAS